MRSFEILSLKLLGIVHQSQAESSRADVFNAINLGLHANASLHCYPASYNTCLQVVRTIFRMEGQ